MSLFNRPLVTYDLYNPDAARARWTSQAYNHYDITLHRETKKGKAHRLVFRFACRYKNASHGRISRARMESSTGTHNLLTSARTCNRRHNRVDDSAPPGRGDQQSLAQAVSKYDPYKHRVIIALRCAVYKRPFNSVLDKMYRDEVELLRPGTRIPHPSTISRDTVAIHHHLARQAKDYFKVRFFFCSLYL